jgi:nucleoid-associated protein YgaU
VTAGAAVLGTATADGRGEWVIVPEKKLPPGDRQLALRAVQPGTGETVKGDADVVLSIVPREKAAVAAPSGSSGSALAVLVPNTPGAPARPLQRPGEAARPAGGGLALDVVEYDGEGRVMLSGRAEPNAEVKLSLDDRTLATTRAGPDGRWTAQPRDKVASGVYALRLDELREGRVVNRLLVPFQRAEPPPGGMPGEFLVVQPGHSLWRIARQTYGAGLRYTDVYAANRAQIANPDLIFPGQIFKLPAN